MQAFQGVSEEKKKLFITISLVVLIIGISSCLYFVLVPFFEQQNEVVALPPLAETHEETMRSDTFPHDYEYKYGYENTTFDTDGYIKKINTDSITIEDTTPRGQNGVATHELITIKFAKNSIFARGHEFITANDIKVGESVFLVTTNENGVLTAQEIFAQPSTESTDITN